MHFISPSEALMLLEHDALLLYPTETLYALGGRCSVAVQSGIFTLKQRPRTKALPVIANSIEQITHYVHLSSLACSIWYIFPHITQVLPVQERYVYLFGETLAVRLAVTPLLQMLTQHTLLFATSANITNMQAVADYTQLSTTLTDTIPICKDMPTIQALPHLTQEYLHSSIAIKKTAPSTIIRTTHNTITLLRLGNITKQHLQLFGFIVQ